jgi:serine/threonine protein phosphatase PrpC
MTLEVPSCPDCGAVIVLGDRFCEACGTVLSELHHVAIPRIERAVQGPCADCGNANPFDEYCMVCGHRRAAPDRDEAEFGELVLITDRGIQHAGNEDAAAAGYTSLNGGRPDLIAAVVCDGVSTSTAAHAAAAAASKAAVDAMLAALVASRNGRTAAFAALAAATKAAAAEWTDSSTAPSCTYTGVAVVPDAAGAVQITVGNVGDSRAYWLPEQPDTPRQLTVDDCLARELIDAGASPDSEPVLRGAHTLTRWLGADADPQPWTDSSVSAMTATGPGWLLVCSDGLWNYLPDAADLARFRTGTDLLAAARAMVEYALEAGGADNITVVIIPIGGTA